MRALLDGNIDFHAHRQRTEQSHSQRQPYPHKYTILVSACSHVPSQSARERHGEGERTDERSAPAMRDSRRELHQHPAAIVMYADLVSGDDAELLERRVGVLGVGD